MSENTVNNNNNSNSNSSSSSNGNNSRSRNILENLKNIFNDVLSFFFELIDISQGMDRKGTIQKIKNNKRMKGANAWLLMCSIMIASLGLDLNSPAVIIGAMLISPLMSPILGVGLGIGINDRETLNVSLKHFGIAIGIALFTSTIYFFFTPFGEATPEILARTKPGTLDALVAFFGGIAGIISGSRIDKSSAIPGVAIATALMPPLCVTGFGIASGNWTILINSFYLFFLNAVLVAFATFLIVRFLRFPMKQYETVQERRKMLIFIYTFSILAVLPSISILSQVWGDIQLKRNTEKFLKEYHGDHIKYIDSWEIAELDSVNTLAIKIYGSGAQFFDKEKMEAKLKEEGLDNMVVDLIPTSEVDLAKYRKLESEISGFKSIAEQFEIVKNAKTQDEITIQNLEAKIDSILSDTIPFSKICQEVQTVFPTVKQITFAEAQESNFDTISQIPILLLSWQPRTPRSIIRQDKPKIGEFIKVRIGLDTIKVIDY